MCQPISHCVIFPVPMHSRRPGFIEPANKEMVNEIRKEGFGVGEAYLASATKASETPVKDWLGAHGFLQVCFGGGFETCRLAPFEIDVVSVVLIRHLYLEGNRIVGENKEGGIAVSG